MDAEAAGGRPVEEQLREAEAKYRTLIEQSPGITYIDALEGPGVTLYISPQVEQVLGFSQEEWLSDPLLWEKLLHPDDRDREIEASNRHHESGRPYRSQYRLYGKDGKVRWIRDEAVVVRDEKGRPRFCHGVLYDITEQKRTEDELQRRGAVLEAVAYAAERFLVAPLWTDAIDDVLARLGSGTSVSRVYVFENDTEGDHVVVTQRYEWVAEGIESQINNPELHRLPLREAGFGRWEDSLSRGEVVEGIVREVPETERSILEEQSIRSILAVPIFVGQEWWGFIGFDDCSAERRWSAVEVDALKAVVGILGATIQRERTQKAARRAEDRYRMLVDLSPDAIVIHTEGRIVFANPKAAELVGAASPTELIGRSTLEFVHPDFRSLVLERLERLGRGEAVPMTEQRFVRVDGSLVDVEVAAAPFEYEGKPAIQVVFRDIGRRKDEQEELRQRNEYLAALNETTLGLMNRLELEGLLENIVLRAAALLRTDHGYLYVVDAARDEIELRVGVGVFRQSIGFRLHSGEGLAGKVWQTGRPLTIDDYDAWEGRSPAFPQRVFRATTGVPLTSGSDVVGVIGVALLEEGRTFSQGEVEALTRFAGLASVALDHARLYREAQRELAERTVAQEQLRKAEAKFRTLVEQIPSVAYIDAFDGVTPGRYITEYVSPQIEQLLGYPPHEFIRDPGLWPSLLHPADRARVLAADEHHYITGEPLRHEYRLRARDGRVVWVLDEAVLVDTGRARFSQGVLFDITERKRAEEELEGALRIERQAAERLRAIDEMKNTFLHAVSHELRTPLSAILGLAVTLAQEDIDLSPDESRDLLNRLAANARKLERLLSDLLDLDRLDRGIIEPRRRPTELGSMVRRVIETSDVMGSRTVRLDTQYVVVPADGAKVERIVENLLANTVKHTPTDSLVSVSVYPEPGGAIIAVDDDGPGVPPDLREVVFEPFRRGPQTPAHSPGAGIGLSLVARFAALHGGRAWVEDRPGGGSSFRVFLPG